MRVRRYLCSELVSLTHNFGQSTVNLEEIWTEGAVLELETPLDLGGTVEIRSRGAFFSATVTTVEPHQFGWRIEVEFSRLTQWDAERFQPQHLLAISPPDVPAA